MWARVRQRVESELLRLPFRHAGAVRPGIIRPAPGHGAERPGTGLYYASSPRYFCCLPSG